MFFLILVLLQVKHWYVDFVDQTDEEVRYKGTYLDWRGIKHSLKHGLFTTIIFFLFLEFQGALLLGVIDFLIHYHIDWAKTNINKKYNHTVDTPQFWSWLGADQMVHQLTYLGLMWLVIS